MAYKVNYVVAKTSPNLYAAAQQGNLNPEQTTQLEQFSWTIQKNKNLMTLPTEDARKEFFKLETDAQDKIKFLYPDATYAQEADTFSDNAVAALKTTGKVLASPLIGLFKGLTIWTRILNTPYLMARQAAQGEGFFNQQTFTDAWDGRRVYDNGALDETVKYFGQERVNVAKGLIAGLKPGEIVSAGGEISLSTTQFDQSNKNFKGYVSKALTQALSNPQLIAGDPKLSALFQKMKQGKENFSTSLALRRQ
jgi:hypothetical protein